MKKIAIFACGFLLALVVMLALGLVSIPHKVLVDTYFYTKVPGVKIIALNQMIRQADNVWELEIISGYAQRVEGNYLPANYPTAQRAIAKKMLKLALRDPNPEDWGWCNMSNSENGMMVALRWCDQILWTQTPEGHEKVQRMVEKYWKLYQTKWGVNEDELALIQCIRDSKSS